MRNGVLAGAATILTITVQAGTAIGDDFYSGRTVKIVVSSAAGGGYDRYARLLARHMTNYLPGKPTMIVLNMPGARGLIAANHVYNIAEKDGSIFGTFNRYIVYMPLLGDDRAKFRPELFQWVGTTASYSNDAYLLVIRNTLPHRSIVDLRNPEIPLSVGETGSDVPAVLKEALGLSMKLVSGYKGSDDMEIAFERGELDAHTSGWSSIQSRHSNWLATKLIRPVIQFGRIDRLPALSDIPTARELARTEEDKALIEFAELPLMIARPFAAPPGVPTERIEMLREAFWKSVTDTAYIEEGTKQKLELTPKNGTDVQAIVNSLASAKPTVIDRYKKALGNKVPSGG